MSPSIIDKLSDYTGEKLPDNVGPAYDRSTKLGSWVTSGVNAYRSALNDWSEAKKYLPKWNESDDPTLLYYKIHQLLRGPVPLPKNLLSILTNPKAIDPLWTPAKGIASMKTKYDAGIKFPYSDYTEIRKSKARNIGDLVDELNNLDFDIGYEYVRDFEMGSIANWNLQIYPYKSSYDGPVRPLIDTSSIPPYRYSLVPDLPLYTLPNVSSVLPSYHMFSFSRDCPVLNWELQFGNINPTELDLFNGMQISVFESFKYNMLLSITILDDVYLSMERYMRLLMNRLYNLPSACAAPYWATLFLVPITIFRPEYKVNFQFALICSPITWSPNLSGEQNATTEEHRVSIEFSVVGIIPPSNETSNPDPYYRIGNDYNIMWNEISLDPNNNWYENKKEQNSPLPFF